MVAFFGIVTANTFNVGAQTRAYRYTHSVVDGVKIGCVGNPNGIYYFTFTEGYSKCYESDVQGVSTSNYNGYFKYAGNNNGILVYEHVESSSFNNVGEQYLLISEDFSRMNWRIGMDDMVNPRGSVRVLEYVSNPQNNSRNETPLQLY